jgi:hypothetical protein
VGKNNCIVPGVAVGSAGGASVIGKGVNVWVPPEDLLSGEIAATAVGVTEAEGVGGMGWGVDI